MGHTVCQREFPGTMSPEDILNNVREVVKHSGDGYGTERIHFSQVTFDSAGIASDWLDQQGRSCNYDGAAARFYDYSGMKPTKKWRPSESALARRGVSWRYSFRRTPSRRRKRPISDARSAAPS